MSQTDTGGGGGAVANNVYIRSDEYAWIPARLVEQDNDTAKVAIPQYESEEFIMSDGGKAAIGFESAIVKLKDYQGRALPLQNCGSDGTLKEVDDLVDLPYLHEAAILYTLKKRHYDGKPYSRVGNILVAVNPYQWLGDLYTDQVRMQYAQKIVWDNHCRDPRNGLPPHPYEESSLCYKALAIERQNQSILVTGISGAGKTETVKICMDHIATMQQDPNDKSTDKSLVVKRILDSNRLLEAFGNAKTRHNDNSSRFGKYIMLQFHHIDGKKPGDRPRSALAGSTCEVYLLEKSRVVLRDDTERTFHAFYQLLAAPDDKKTEIWKGLKGTTNESFAYVGTAPHVLIDGKEDSAHFIDTNAALELIGISGEKNLTLWRAIAACLQLGNLTFAPKPGDEERTVITSSKEFKDLAELIGCDNIILEKAFTERTIKTRGEEYKVPLKFDIAKECADAFAEEIYVKTFLWLVRTINDATCAENNYPGGASISHGLIGLLDIFGFESFPVNGFEQLCINYCNEKLQHKFNRDIFAAVEEENKAEGLNLDDIKYDDNSDVLELIEGRFSGVMDQLQGECIRPKGSAELFYITGLTANRLRGCLIRTSDWNRLEFGIHHYAATVIYCAQDFVVRNRDVLPIDVAEAAKLCHKNEIISTQLDNNRCSNIDVKDKLHSGHQSPAKRRKEERYNFAADQLRTQLTTLMKDLNETQSRYVCCIKPNTQKRKLMMQHVSSIKQLKCSGVVSAALMSRSTYATKLFHAEVVERYGLLNEGNGKICYPDVKSECEDICKMVLKHFETKDRCGRVQSGFLIGKTRVYFRSGCLEYLESERSKRLVEADDETVDSWVYCSSMDYA